MGFVQKNNVSPPDNFFWIQACLLYLFLYTIYIRRSAGLNNLFGFFSQTARQTALPVCRLCAVSAGNSDGPRTRRLRCDAGGAQTTVDGVAHRLGAVHQGAVAGRTGGGGGRREIIQKTL